MSADVNLTDDEWFWKAWSEKISKRASNALQRRFSTHANATHIHPRTLLSSEFLEQYAALVMLLERFPAAPGTLAGELANWRPLSYDDYFRAAGLPDGRFAISAYEGAPPSRRRRFGCLVAQLDEECLCAVEAVDQLARRGRADLLPRLCRERALRIRLLIDETARLIAGSPPGNMADGGLALTG
jgi:hypothetical protein